MGIRNAFVALFTLLTISGNANAAMEASSSPGSVRFIWHDNSTTDGYNSNPSYQGWIASHMWGQQVYSTWFDQYLGFFPNGFAYVDSYAIYSEAFAPGNSLLVNHPDFIATDTHGNRLYINYYCNYNGTGQCTQYAADITNPNYITYYISNLKALQAKGYRAHWMDDVNLDVTRVSDGYGNPVAPRDPATGAPMTNQAWSNYFASFVTQVTQGVPGMTILHNSLWGADPGGTGNNSRWLNPAVTKEIQAADYINLERGVVDSGIQGGGGYWGIESFFAYVDYVHSLGKGVVYDSESYAVSYNANWKEYNLAGYFLTSNGNDAVGDDSASPVNWFAGYGANIGNPTGARYSWNGLLRRDFQYGTVLFAEPGSQAVTVSFPGYTRVDGTSASSLTLAGSNGATMNSPAGIVLLATGATSGSGGGGSTPSGGSSALTAPGTATFSNITQTGLTVNWTAATGATGGYGIWRATGSSAATWSQIGWPAAGATSYSDSGLSAGTTYYYIVASTDGINHQSSAQASVTTAAAGVGTPGTPTFSRVSYTTLTIKWTPAASATGYAIWRATGSSTATWTQIAWPSASVTSYHDSGLAQGQTYYYIIAAQDAAGNHRSSAMSSVTTK